MLGGHGMGAAFNIAEEVENAAVFPLPKVRLGAALRSLFSDAHKESMGPLKRKGEGGVLLPARASRLRRRLRICKTGAGLLGGVYTYVCV